MMAPNRRSGTVIRLRPGPTRPRRRSPPYPLPPGDIESKLARGRCCTDLAGQPRRRSARSPTMRAGAGRSDRTIGAWRPKDPSEPGRRPRSGTSPPRARRWLPLRKPPTGALWRWRKRAIQGVTIGIRYQNWALTRSPGGDEAWGRRQPRPANGSTGRNRHVRNQGRRSASRPVLEGVDPNLDAGSMLACQPADEQA